MKKTILNVSQLKVASMNANRYVRVHPHAGLWGMVALVAVAVGVPALAPTEISARTLSDHVRAKAIAETIQQEKRSTRSWLPQSNKMMVAVDTADIVWPTEPSADEGAAEPRLERDAELEPALPNPASGAYEDSAQTNPGETWMPAERVFGRPSNRS